MGKLAQGKHTLCLVSWPIPRCVVYVSMWHGTTVPHTQPILHPCSFYTLLLQPQEEGLIPRILSQLFSALDSLQKATPADQEPPECFFSAVEVYNEGLVDLLEPTAGHLAVREDYLRGMYVDGALEVAVNNGMWAMMRNILFMLRQLALLCICML